MAKTDDKRGAFKARCNAGMVGLEAPEEGDVAEVRALVQEHLERTGSPVAESVLARWDELLASGAFVKVMPHDYKRVLREAAGEHVPVAA